MSGQFKADKFGEGAKRPVPADERIQPDVYPIYIDSPAAAMRLDAGAFAGHLEAVADVIEEQEMAAGYLIREAMRRIHEQQREIERLKFHAGHLRKSAEEAAEYLKQTLCVSQTPGPELQHIVFSLASALATSRNLPL
jgi:hypothetical protein